MNIVYAVKIFAALTIVMAITRLVAGAGLRAVLEGEDFKKTWTGIVGTLAVSCFSTKVPLFFAVLPVWAVVYAGMLGKDGSGRLPAYGLLCCICPSMYFDPGDIGPLHQLLLLTPFRILSIVLLLPAALRLAGRRDAAKSPSWLVLCDVATVAYSLWWFGRHFASMTLSTIGREFIAQLLDTLLPYYVLTRGCVDPAVRRRFLAFVLAGSVYQAFVGVAESLSGHYLYSQFQWLYAASFTQATGLMRGAWLRAEAAFPGPLALAMLMLMAIGIWFALKRPERNRSYLVLLGALLAALLATYGRGPILASGVLFAGVWLLRRMTGRRYLLLMFAATVVFTISWKAGLGDLVNSALTSASAGDATAEFNVRYREELLEISMALLKQSPWLGVPNYLAQMESLRQGEGIIDIVNTYLVVALNTGLLGIFLVFLPFVLTLWRDASSVRLGDESQREALAWMPTTLAVMAAIFTTSPVSIVQPIMVWAIALPLARQQEQSSRPRGRGAVPGARPFGATLIAGAE